MLKTLLLFLFGLLIFQGANAQHHKASDTLAFYLDNYGFLAHKNNADHIMVILPADSSTGNLLYPVIQYYLDGKPMQTGISTNKDYRSLRYEGLVTYYYKNGHKQSIENYVGGYVTGDVAFYYPNGQLYATEKYDALGNHRLIACYDSTGTTLAQNGNGEWITYDVTTNQEIERGMIKDSLEDGAWQETYFKTSNYVTTYAKGAVIASTDPSRQLGSDLIFTAVEHEPQFNGDFGSFLAKNVSYPSVDKENNVQGRVLLTFVVEKDGSLSDVKIISSPDKSLGQEALRVLKLSSPWIAGKQNDRRVRVQYTVPISFTLGSN